jgi:hypothetical protein
MLRPDAARTPRDTVATIALLERSEMADGISAARDMVRHLSLHPYPPALSGLIMTNTYLMVRYDTLHVLDGGVTMRILIIAGNFMYYSVGEWLLRLANACLAALPRHDDFTHFQTPLWAMDEDKKNARRVKMFCNWRCTEYEQLISQMM